jgi:hypothetical protein
MALGFEPEDEPLLAAELPDEVDARVKRLPLYRQEVWLQAYDEAMEEFGDRQQAETIAWAEAVATRSETEEEPRRIS